MLSNYKLKQYDGIHPDIHMYVGPFAMDRKVLREFDGYPIVTDLNFHWFILLSGNDVVGFLSLEEQKKGIQITNVYVLPDFRKKKIGEALIREAMEWCRQKSHKHIEVDCLESSLITFKRLGFKVMKSYVKWNRLAIDL